VSVIQELKAVAMVDRVVWPST